MSPRRWTESFTTPLPRGVVTTSLVSLVAGVVVVALGAYIHLSNQARAEATSAVQQHERAAIKAAHSGAATHDQITELRGELALIKEQVRDLERRIGLLEHRRRRR